VAKEFVKEVTGREAKSVLKEGWEHHNLFGVGMSSPVTGCHCSMVRSGRKWFTTSLLISLSSTTNGWKRCECEAAMTGEKLCYGEESVQARRWRSRGRRRKMVTAWEMVSVDVQIPFLTSAATKRRTMVYWFAPEIMDQRSIILDGKKNSLPSVHNGGR
jgi:hypothetical protein